MGQLALDNSDSEAVGSFAQTRINDRSQNRTQAEAVASKLPVALPSQRLLPRLARLQKLNGHEF